jgi:hypothetical protein
LQFAPSPTAKLLRWMPDACNALSVLSATDAFPSDSSITQFGPAGAEWNAVRAVETARS